MYNSINDSNRKPPLPRLKNRLMSDDLVFLLLLSLHTSLYIPPSFFSLSVQTKKGTELKHTTLSLSHTDMHTHFGAQPPACLLLFTPCLSLNSTSPLHPLASLSPIRPDSHSSSAGPSLLQLSLPLWVKQMGLASVLYLRFLSSLGV